MAAFLAVIAVNWHGQFPVGWRGGDRIALQNPPAQEWLRFLSTDRLSGPMISHRFTIGVVFVLSMAVVAAAQDRMVGVASVIDGDTIEIHGQRIRLFGIDAPESSQLCVRPTGERWRCGQRASFALADRVGRATVSCQPHDDDRLGRRLQRLVRD
ncbi:MAG: thermonuclease family protein [Rhodoplanes sp.]